MATNSISNQTESTFTPQSRSERFSTQRRIRRRRKTLSGDGNATLRNRQMLLEGLEPRLLLAGDLLNEISVSAPSSSIDGLVFAAAEGEGEMNSIHGQKYEDANGNGTKDANESGLNGWTIVLLDAGGNVVDQQTTHDMDLDGIPGIDPTADSGWYWFENLPDGDFTVAEVERDDWIQVEPPRISPSVLDPLVPAAPAFIQPGFDLFTTDPATTVVNLDLDGTGQLIPVPLQGAPLPNSGPSGIDTIVRRLDGPGQLDAGQSATVPIELVALSLVSVEPVDLDGTLFDVHIQGGLNANLPQQQGQMTVTRTDFEGGVFDSTLPVNAVLTLVDTNDPTNFQQFPFDDVFQGGGVWSLQASPGDPRLIDPNLAAELPSGGLHPGSMIDPDCPGHTVKVLTEEQAQLARHGVLPAMQAVPIINDQREIEFVMVSPGVHRVGLNATQTFAIVNFGNVAKGSIHGVKFEDLNGDGVLDPDEPPMAGVQVTATWTDAAGVAHSKTTATIADGQYAFEGLQPNVEYTVEETPPAGTVATTPTSTKVSIGSGIEIVGTEEQAADLIAGGLDADRVIVDSSLVFGNAFEGSIHGFQYEDLNANGVRDPGERPLADMEIALTWLDADGNQQMKTTRTDANGEYWFLELPPSGSTQYMVTATPPDGAFQTSPNPGPIVIDASGMEVVATPEQGDAVQRAVTFPWWWEVVIDPVSMDGVDRPQETLMLEGTAMIGFDEAVNLSDPGSEPFRLVDSDGLPLALPDGSWAAGVTLMDVELSGRDSLGNEIVLSLNDDEESFGRVNAVASPGDPNLVGDSFLDVFFDITITDVDGRSETIAPLDPNGNPVPVRVGMEFAPEDNIARTDLRWMPTIFWAEDLGRNLLDIQWPHPLWDKLISIHAIPHVEQERPVRTVTRPELSIGTAFEGSIHGYKFEDLDGNGQWDAGEPPMENVEIVVSWTDAAGLPQELRTTTDAKGEYWFEWLRPGQTYQVTEVAPAGFVQTTPNPSPIFIGSGQEHVATEEQGQLVQRAVSFPWWWEVVIDPVPTPGGADLPPERLMLEGMAMVAFSEAVNTQTGQTFNLVDPDNGLPLPLPNGRWLVDTEIVSMDLRGQDSLGRDVELTLSENRASLGEVFVNARRGQPLLTGDSFFDVFVDLTISDPRTGDSWTLSTLDPRTGEPLPVEVGMVFTPEDQIARTDIRWMPTIFWASGLGRDLLDIQPPHELWDRLISMHAIPHVELEKPVRPVLNEQLAFGNREDIVPGSIHGYKFEDLNVNGVDDDIDGDGIGDEPRVGGVWIVLSQLDPATGATVDVERLPTNADGEYWFEDLKPGTYVVSEISPLGSVPTTPTSYTVTVGSGEEYVALPGQAHLDPDDPRVEIVIGPELAFGNAYEGSIHGYKFEDLNLNGVWDAGERPVPGVTIEAVGVDPNSATAPVDIRTAVTDANGEYWFTWLQPGWVYTVSEVAPFGATQTTVDPPALLITSGKEWVATPQQGIDVLNSVEVPWWLEVTIQPANRPDPVTLMPAGNVMLTFGQPASLDPNNPDGTFPIVDPENGLPLEVPEEGGPWLISFSLHAAELMDEQTGAVMRVSGQGRLVIQREGDQLVTLPRSEFQVDSFFDIFVEIDMRDPQTGEVMRLTLEDMDRPVRVPLQFPMDMMPPDMPTIPADDVRWMPAIFWASGLGRELLDDAGQFWDELIEIHAIPHGEPIKPVRIMQEPLLAIGNAYEGSIHGYKFEDLNGNGVRDPGEPGLGGVQIVAVGYDANGNAVDNRTTVTNDRGEYWLTWLTPGLSYEVTEVPPAGSVQTTADPPRLYISSGKEWVATPQQGIDVLNSVEFPWWLQVEIQPVDRPQPQILMPGGMVMLSFGQPQSLNPNNPGGTFEIVDPENGLPLEVPDEGGPWLIPFELHQAELVDDQTGAQMRVRGEGQVAVQKVRDSLVTLNPREFNVDSFFDIWVELDVPGDVAAASASDGLMTLTLEDPDTPVRIPIEFPMAMMPEDMPRIPADDVRWMPAIFWASGLGRNLLDDAGELWDRLIEIHAIPHGEPIKPVRIMQEPLLAFGNREDIVPGSIHGYKFEDLNVNGVDDDIDGDGIGDEPRVGGVWIVLSQLDPATGATVDVERLPTNADGEYWFEDLKPGTYVVSEIPPLGSVPTTPTSYTVTVGSGEEYVALPGQAHLDPDDPRVEIVIGPELAFGNAYEGSIHGYKFEDLNLNGVWDAGERPVPGVTIEAVGVDPNSATAPVDIRTAVTDANGEYWFTWLQPGWVYTVSEVAPFGATQTTADPPALLITSGKEWVATPRQGIDVLNSVEVPWWLEVTIQPANRPDPVTLMPAGNVMLTFGQPASLDPNNPDGTFPIVDAENGLPLEVPEEGGPWLIPFSLHAAELMDEQTGAVMRVSGQGRLVIQREGDQLVTLSRSEFQVDSFFDIFVEIDMRDPQTGEVMRLTLEDMDRPVRVPLQFPMDMMPPDMPTIPADDVRWMPAIFWASGLGRELLDDAGQFWDELIEIHAIPHGEPIKPVRIMQEPLLAIGNAYEGSIHGYKFEDLNGNGVRDPGEPGLGGVQIVAVGYDANGNAVDNRTTVTNDRGEYWLTWLTPGLSYEVTEVPPAGSVQTTADPPRLYISSGKEWVATPQQGIDVLNSVEFPWWLQVEIQPVDRPQPQILMPGGMVMLSFGQPQSLNPNNPGGTFEIVDPENGLPLEVPDEGGPWLIPFELHQAELVDDQTGAQMRVRGEGQVAVQRVRDSLVTLNPREFNVDSFFDIWVELDVPGDVAAASASDGLMTLTLQDPDTPVRIPIEFPMAMMPEDMPRIPADDVRWMPAIFWASGLGRNLLDDAGELWDRLIEIHAIPHGEPIKPVRIMQEPLLAFGNREDIVPGSIHGYKFEDLNVNGVDDDIDGDGIGDEPRVGGVWIVLSQLDPATGATVDVERLPTNADGEYWFEDLKPGTYVVSEIPPLGSVPTTPTSYTVTVGSGEEYVALPGQAHLDPDDPRVEIVIGPELAFGNAYEGSIHGYKFEDLNLNGVWDAGERPVPGVTIEAVGVDPNSATAPVDIRTAVTDANGEYWFTWLQPGWVYTVSEVAPFGATQTTADPPALLITSGKEWVATPRQGIDVLNSVEVPWWLEVTIQPANRPDPVTLMPAGNVMLTFGQPASLDPNNPDGTFPIVDAENGLPLEVPEEGGPWLIPFSLHAAELMDEQTGAVMRVSGQGRLVIQREGDQLVTLSRSEFQVDSFFDIFVEIDMRDPQTGEVMRLTLEDMDRPVRVPLQFPMDMMPPDMPTIPADDVRWMPAIFWASGLGRELLDDAGQFWDELIEIHAIPHGEPIKPVRIMQEPLLAIGNAYEGSIHGYKFEDLNGNGVRDPGEPGLGGVQIVAVGYDANGNAVDNRTTVTNDRGEYWLTWLTPGLSYEVTEVPPAGSVQTTADPPRLYISSGKEWVATPQQGIDVLNSVEFPWWLQVEIQPVDRPQPQILMPGGMVMLSFGQPQSLNPNNPGGTFEIVDPENGLPLEVPDEGGPWLIPFELHQAELVDDQTSEQMRVRGEGQVAVQKVRDSLVTLNPREFNVDSFFDIWTELSVPGDDGELMTLTLEDPDTPVRIPIEFPMAMMPEDMPRIPADDVRWMPAIFWASGLGRNLLDDAGELWDRLIEIHAIPHGEPIKPVRIMQEPLLAFGNTYPGSIHGYKFDDLNVNGVDDDNDGDGVGDEPRVGGIWITLSGDADGDGTLDSMSLQTNPNGEYWFENLHPGVYTVTETPPFGSIPTTPTSYTVTVGSRQELVALPGQAHLDPTNPDEPREEIVIGPRLAFGNAYEGSIHGYKFLDQNGDGVWNDNEQPLPGVEIVIKWTDTAGVEQTQSTTTDANGEYWFQWLRPGVTYHVAEVTPTGTVQTTPDVPPLLVTSGKEWVGTPEQGRSAQLAFSFPWWWEVVIEPVGTDQPQTLMLEGMAEIRTSEYLDPQTRQVIAPLADDQGIALAPPRNQAVLVETEIVALSLISAEPIPVGDSFFDVFLELAPNSPQNGEIQAQVASNIGSSGEDGLVGDSFFDVFVELVFVDRETGEQMRTAPANPTNPTQRGALRVGMDFTADNPAPVPSPLPPTDVRWMPTFFWMTDTARELRDVLPDGTLGNLWDELISIHAIPHSEQEKPVRPMVEPALAFGNQVRTTAEVHGTKFQDRNGNGVWDKDQGERGLAGWEIILSGVSDTGDRIIKRTTTMEDDPNTTVDETGMYWLTEIPPGTYRIREVGQNEWRQTSPPGGGWNLTLSAGQVVEDRDFGNQRLARRVRLQLQTSDESGQPIERVTRGNTFYLDVYAEDLRAAATGVFSAYLDTLYDSTYVSVDGPIIYGDNYPNGRTGDTSVAGLIDEAGAVGGQQPLGFGESLLLRIPLKALRAGDVEFAPNRAEDATSVVLLYGESLAEPASAVSYVGTSIIIGGSPWQNPDNQFDVDNLGFFSALDLLLVINELNSPQYSDPVTREFVAPTATVPPPYLDVNGDGLMTAVDLAIAINELNRQSGGGGGSISGEGEASFGAATSLSSLSMASGVASFDADLPTGVLATGFIAGQGSASLSSDPPIEADDDNVAFAPRETSAASTDLETREDASDSFQEEDWLLLDELGHLEDTLATIGDDIALQYATPAASR